MSEPWVWMEEPVRVGSIPLSLDEARHLAARRLKVDDSLVVFDGRGHMAEARIESLGKHSSVVAVDSIAETARPDSAFVPASAIPKGDRLSTMLQMPRRLRFISLTRATRFRLRENEEHADESDGDR